MQQDLETGDDACLVPLAMVMMLFCPKSCIRVCQYSSDDSHALLNIAWLLMVATLYLKPGRLQCYPKLNNCHDEKRNSSNTCFACDMAHAN